MAGIMRHEIKGGIPMTRIRLLAIQTAAILSTSIAPSLAFSQSGFRLADNDSIFVDGQSFAVVPGKSKGDASVLIRKLGAQALGPGAIVFRSGDRLYIADVGPLEGVRLGSDRYGSDRDDSASETQAERDWREWQNRVRQNQSQGAYGERYGSDRSDADRYYASRNVPPRAAYYAYRPLPARPVDEETYIGIQDRFYRDSNGGADRYGSDRYGSDRSDADRYYASRNVPPRAAYYAYRPLPARPVGEETYIGIQDRFYRDSMATDRYAADRYGESYGSSSRVVINDPDYAEYKLRKIFDENWTVSDFR